MNPSPADYSIQLFDPSGNPVLLLDTFSSLDAARTINGDGALTLVLPAYSLVPLARAVGIRENQIARELVDWWMVVQRRVWSAWRPLLQTAWLIRRPQKAGTGGEKTYTLNAYHANDLLKARQVWYAAGSAQASKTAAADDLIKAVIRENYTAATDATRDIGGSGLFTIQADAGLGPSISKDFAWQQVLSTIQAVCQSAYTAGTSLFYDIVPTAFNPLSLEFRTYTGQRGTDRGSTSLSQLEFSPERGNLDNPMLDYDYSAEANAALAGGQGDGADRDTATSVDTARATRTPWSRRETFVDATQVTKGDTASLQDEADGAVAAGRAMIRFTGDALDAPGSVFGEQWDIGDRVVASYDGDVFDCWLNTVEVKVSGGIENVTAKLSNIA